MKASETVIEVGEAQGATAAGWHKIESGFRCEQEYQYEHVRKIRIPEVKTPDHFAIGIGFHAGRARWFALNFKTGVDAQRSIEEAVQKAFEEQKLPVTIEAKRQTLNYLDQYVAHWSMRPLPKPVAAEYFIGPAPFDPSDPLFMHRTARLDDVSHYVENGNALCIGESKTTSTSIQDCVTQYTLHGQPMLQYVLWRVAQQGEATHGPVAGIMLDITKKGYGKEKCEFARQFVPVTARSADWYVRSLRTKLRRLADITWDSHVERNISACTRMAGRMRIACPYRDLCVHGRSASIKFVLENGDSLVRWRPSETQQVAPWE